MSRDQHTGPKSLMHRFLNGKSTDPLEINDHKFGLFGGAVTAMFVLICLLLALICRYGT